MHAPLRAHGLQKAHAPGRQAASRHAWQQCLHHQHGPATAWANSRAPVQGRRTRRQVWVHSQATTGTKVSMPSRPGEQIAWGNYMSRALSLRSAVREAATKVMASLAPDAQPTLAIVFVSSIHGQDFEQVIPLLKEMVPSLQHVFGCSGYGIAGGGPEGPEEAEGEPSFSLTLGSIPGAGIQVLHTLRSSIPAPDATPEEWADFVGVPHDSSRPVSFLTFADPRFAQVRDMVAGLDYAFPNSPKIGAILSSGTRSRSRAMFAWSATPHTRKKQWPQRSERRDSSRADFYTSQARAELPQLRPRPSMPSLGGDSVAEGSPQAESESGSKADGSGARGAATDSAEARVDSSSNGTDGMFSSGEALQGASRNGTGEDASSSSESQQVTPEQPGPSGRATPENLGQSPLQSQREPQSQAQTGASNGASTSETLPSSSPPQSQSQDNGSSSSSSNNGGKGWSGAGVSAQSGVQALGSFFSRVMAPLSSLGNAFQQQRQQQQRLGRSNDTDSERGQGSATSSSSSSSGSSSSGGSRDKDEASSSAAADRRNSVTGSSLSSSPATSRDEREVLNFVPTKQDVDGSAVIDLEDILSSGSSSSSSSSTVTPPAQRTNRVASTFQSLFGRRGARAREDLDRSDGALEEESNEDGSQGGVYMYGAVVLALHGDVVLDTVTSMGYRAPSPCIWRIEGVTSKNEIVSIVPEALSDAGGSSMGSSSDGRGNILGQSGRGPSARSSLLEDSSDEEYDDSELSELFAGSPEVQAITAVVDMLDGLGDEGIEQWSEILDGAAVAIAPDSSKRAHELGPEDWELLPLVDILEEYGVLKVGNSPVLGGGCDLRPGHRMKLMVRDAQGVREGMSNAMLRYKRNNLGAMMSGTDLPPTFGTLLLTDVDRGIECYGMPHHESRIAHSYVPAPLAGIFGGAQIGPLKGGPGGGNGSTGILENSAVLGVLRAATDKSPAAVKRQADAKADAVRQEKEMSEGGASASTGSIEAKGEDGDGGEEKRSEEGKK